MSEGWVLNASPTLTLAKVGHLNLLVELAPEIGIPLAVMREVTAGPEDDPGQFGHPLGECGQTSSIDK